MDNHYERKPFSTVYSLAWDRYLETDGYKDTEKIMKAKGHVQPYLNNILKHAFDAGWNARALLDSIK